MWHVKALIAVDDDGNIVEIDDDYVTVTVTLKSDTNIKVTRGLLLDETPPCLSVAVSDLINYVTD